MAGLTLTEHHGEDNNEFEIPNVSDWRLWCRLCAKDDMQGNINVFLKNEHSAPGDRADESERAAVNDMALATAIGKYFWVNVSASHTNKLTRNEAKIKAANLPNFGTDSIWWFQL